MKKPDIKEWVLGFGILIIIGLIFYTNLFHYNFKMNADIASEAVLARLIWDSGEIIPSSWFASTELRAFGTPNLAALLYGITKNMSLAMGISCSIMTLGIAVSGYFFASRCCKRRKDCLLFVLLCLGISNHYTTLELTYLFAGYYSIHVIILFFTLGVYIDALSHTKINYRMLIGTVCAAFAMGIQGVRGILILSGPLAVTEICREMYLWYLGRAGKKKDWIITFWSLGLVAVGYAGTCLPFSVGQNFSRNIRNGFSKLWKVVFPQFLDCIGFTEAGIAGKIVLVCVFVLTVCSMVKLLWWMLQKREINPEDWGYLQLCLSPLLTVLMVSFTTVESSERYYFVVLYAMAFAIENFLSYVDSRLKVRGGVLHYCTASSDKLLFCLPSYYAKCGTAGNR